MYTPVLTQFKGLVSVCHSNCVDLVAKQLCVMATMPMVFGSTLTFPTFVLFFFFTFFRAYVLLHLGVSLMLGLQLGLRLGVIFYI